MKVGGFSEHQNKTSDTDRYEGYFFTARVSQFNVKTMERIFEQRSELQFAKCLIVHVLSSSYSVSNLELRKKGKQCSNGAFVFPSILYSIRSVYIMKECMRTMSSANSGLWGPFPLNITPNSLPTLLPKTCPRPGVKNARPDPSFARWISTFGFFETLYLWYKFRCDCVFLEWECPWLQQYP